MWPFHAMRALANARLKRQVGSRIERPFGVFTRTGCGAVGPTHRDPWGRADLF